MFMRSTIETYQSDYSAIAKKMNQDYTNNISLWSIWWTAANIASRAEAGDESLMGQLGNQVATNNGRGSYYFNMIRPVCNMISGYQRRNRKSLICVPLENGDNATADAYTKIFLHIFKKENVYDVISEAFYQGALVTGLSFLHLYNDFREDSMNGDLKWEHVGYSQVMIDPYWRQESLDDANFIWKRSWMTHLQAAQLMPEDKYDEVMALPGNPSGMSRDGRFQFAPEAMGYTQGNRVTYDEYYYRDFRDAVMIYDPLTGDSFDATYSPNLDIEALLSANPTLIVEKKKIPTVKLAISIQGKVFYNGPQPLNIDIFPWVPVYGFYSKSMPYMYQRIQGVTKQMLDANILFNRRVILTLDMVESQLNSGFIFKEDSVTDPKLLWQTGNGRMIPLKKGASITDVQPIPAPQIPAGFFQVQDTLSELVYITAGISQENMGLIVDDNASGYKSALRQGAGLIAQQPIFDRLDTAVKRMGDIMLQAIPRNYSPAKVRRILEGQEPPAYFYRQEFGKYHCMTQLGFDTESQQQMEFATLMEMRKNGIAISDKRLIMSATVQNKNELIAEMEQQQQQIQQAQQKAQEVEQQLQASQAMLAQARAYADYGLGGERFSRMPENKAMAQANVAKALREEYQAVLNAAKAQKELQGMDIQQLREIAELYLMIKGQEQVTKNQVAQESMMDEQQVLGAQ